MARTTTVGIDPAATSQAAAEAVVSKPNHLARAGFVTRLIALVIDIVLVSVSSVIFAALVSLILNFFGISGQQFNLEAAAPGVIALLRTIIILVSGLAVLLYIPAYFVFFWVLNGATPGKQILGLRIIRTNREPVGWLAAGVRFIGYFISAICLFLGFLWILIDRKSQGWHDKLAGTYVIYTWDIPPQEQ